MVSLILSSAVVGLKPYIINIEVDISSGMPGFTIVGLPDTAVKESKNRVKAAIKNSGFKFPERKITVNLAPAYIKKEGASFDLPISLGILSATGQIKNDGLRDFLILGELSLDGKTRSIKGTLPIVLSAAEKYKFILPAANLNEAIIGNRQIFPVNNLKEVVSFLNEEIEISPVNGGECSKFDDGQYLLNFSEIRAQHYAKRGLEIAAAGGHNLLLIGPPGSGKTILAQRLPSILPSLSFIEALETTKIYSVAGLTPAEGLIKQRPFRSPHHTISDIALIGGGSNPRPGEVSLAHNGVLFLDEFPEFQRNVLEVLRQPLEKGEVTISRSQCSVTFPARFSLVAAMNPCPCGYFGDEAHPCSCSPYQIQKYISRISGPLLDRIDLHIQVSRIKFAEIQGPSLEESSEQIRKRIEFARKIQIERFKKEDGIYYNAAMSIKLIEKYCDLGEKEKNLMHLAMDKMNLSARGYHRILKVSRTIADLEGKENIGLTHLSEAIQYRNIREIYNSLFT